MLLISDMPSPERATSFTPSTSMARSIRERAICCCALSEMFSSLKLSAALICSELTLGMKEMPMSLTW